MIRVGRRFSSFAGPAAAVILSTAAATAQPAPSVAPTAVLPTTVGWDHDGEADLSGLACGPERGGERGCVIVDDEQRRLRFVTFAAGRFELGPEMAVLDRETTDPVTGVTTVNKEADLEAVSRDGDVYWAFGSHGTKRKPTAGQATCPLQPDRRHIYRFAVDPQTDLPSFAFDRKVAAPEIRRIDRLPAVLAQLPELTSIIDAPICGDHGGFTIEGGAVSGGRMMLGVRAPLFGDGAEALIVEIDAEGLADGVPVVPIAHHLALGKGMGVRDLAAVKGGHLILAGPSGSDDPPATANPTPREKSTIWFWPTGTKSATPVAVLEGVPGDGKPEALAVLDGDDTGWRVLVLCDGVVGGAPAEYRLSRP